MKTDFNSNECLMLPLLEVVTGVNRNDWSFLKSANEVFTAAEQKINTNVLRAASVCLRHFPNSEHSIKYATFLDQAVESEDTEIVNDAASIIRHRNFSMLKSAGDFTDLAKTILLSPIVVGGLGGAVVWSAKENTRLDESKNEALKDKIRYFRGLSQDIEKDLINKYPQAAYS